ncbi:hypothetical protein [Bacillus velezensis]|uniref:hypothetical protein n=1 Tax=Bacillus velezensis TaxID=492670 RepID=UPI00155A8228|nr:hypothetical protein [Bacillus velezensis]
MINEQGARSYIHWSYAAQEVLGGQHGENSVMMQKPFLRFKMLTLCRRRIANFQ